MSRLRANTIITWLSPMTAGQGDADHATPQGARFACVTVVYVREVEEGGPGASVVLQNYNSNAAVRHYNALLIEN